MPPITDAADLHFTVRQTFGTTLMSRERISRAQIADKKTREPTTNAHATGTNIADGERSRLAFHDAINARDQLACGYHGQKRMKPSARNSFVRCTGTADGAVNVIPA